MFHVLIDTCVWLDFAENPKHTQVLDTMVAMLALGCMRLLVPDIVLAEFQANRARIEKRGEKSLSAHFNPVKAAVRNSHGTKRQKDRVLAYLADVDHRIPLVGGSAGATLNYIEKLLRECIPFPTTDSALLKAAARELHRKGPCHQNKNSMADAVLIETYFECVKAGTAGDRFAFVTLNHSDFSQAGGNRKLPHADIASGFSKIKSLYFTNVADLLRRVDPRLMTEVMYEIDADANPRSLSELLDAMDTLAMQVWYRRHKLREHSVKSGRTKLVTKAHWDAEHAKTGKYNPHLMVDTIWKGALKAAKAAERQLGPDELGPHDDFEWGMINGKLSALRWALGDEWDMLDT